MIHHLRGMIELESSFRNIASLLANNYKNTTKLFENKTTVLFVVTDVCSRTRVLYYLIVNVLPY